MDEREEQTIMELCDDDHDSALQALEVILTEHGLPILGCIKGVLRTHGITFNLDDMAEEVFQQVAMELLSRGRDGELMGVESLKGYVFKAARLRTLRYLRDEARRADLIPLAGTFWDETDNILQEAGLTPAETADLERALAECIDELKGLKKEYVRIMAAHYDDPPSPQEIARLKGVSSVSVRNRLHEARRDLEDCLRKKGQSIPPRRYGGQK